MMETIVQAAEARTLNLDDLHDAEVRAFLETCTLEEAEWLHDALKLQIRAIETQLVDAKAQAHAVRARVFAEQRDTWAADAAATQATDPQWRASATRALALRRDWNVLVKRRRADLRAQAYVEANKPNERAVVVLRGLADDVRDTVQNWFDDGWVLTSSIPCSDGAVCIFKKAV